MSYCKMRMETGNLIPLSTNFKEGLAGSPLPGLNHPLLAVTGQRERCRPGSGEASPPQAGRPWRARSHLGRSPARRHVRGSRVSRGFPGPAASTATVTASSPQAPRAPQARQLAGSSQTYSFPTAYASRRGDVTDLRSTRSAGGRGARAQAPPPASGGRRPVPPCPALDRRASAHGQLPRAQGLRRLARLGGHSW